MTLRLHAGAVPRTRRLDTSLLHDAQVVSDIFAKIADSFRDVPRTPDPWDNLKKRWRTACIIAGRVLGWRQTALLEGIWHSIRIV